MYELSWSLSSVYEEIEKECSVNMGHVVGLKVRHVLGCSLKVFLLCGSYSDLK